MSTSTFTIVTSPRIKLTAPTLPAPVHTWSCHHCQWLLPADAASHPLAETECHNCGHERCGNCDVVFSNLSVDEEVISPVSIGAIRKPTLTSTFTTTTSKPVPKKTVARSWSCHQCMWILSPSEATNAMSRTSCGSCGHDLCGACEIVFSSRTEEEQEEEEIAKPAAVSERPAQATAAVAAAATATAPAKSWSCHHCIWVLSPGQADNGMKVSDCGTCGHARCGACEVSY